MLCVVAPERAEEVIAVCARWETLATVIGEVNDSGRLRVLRGGEAVADMPVGILVDDCPLYDLEPAPPSEALYPAPPAVLAPDADPGDDPARAARLGQPGLTPSRL